MNLQQVMANRISSGLKRKTITSCSKWSEEYRVMGQPFPGNWSFRHHPWTRLMHDAPEEMIVGQKAAQMGYTETALNKVFYAIDVEGKSCLYILPASNPDASDFSTSRFDPALEMSDHLSNMFSDVKNIGHKRAGNANLFIRGSRSRSQLKSLPIGFIVCDELDEMNQDNVSLAFERMSGQQEKQSFLISTPTIDKFGINNYYEASTKDHFFFPCPSCGRQTELIFPECLVVVGDDPEDPKIRETHIICKECKTKLPHEGKIEYLNKGKWVSSRTDRLTRGFYVNQLYSMTVKPFELAQLYLKAQTNPSDEQEFYNSKLGLTHVVEGAKVSDANIHECTGTFKKQLVTPPGALVTMGIDVGTYLHYEVDQWFLGSGGSDINLMAKCRILAEGKVKDFEELDLLFRDFNVRFAVIDANPERRKALEFAQRHYGRVRLCFYGTGVSGKSITIHAQGEHTITVDRTSWLDLSLSRFRSGQIVLPVDLSMEYKSHIKALVRIYDKDSLGNPIGKYVKGNEDDHLAHARNYSEIALPLGVSLSQSQNMESVL